MEVIPATPAVSTTTSLVSRDGNSLQRSERDAALLSEIQIDLQSSENSTVVLILLAILQSITENTTSGDVIYLSICRAKDMCIAAGVSEADFQQVVTKFVKFSKQARSWNPFAF